MLVPGAGEEELLLLLLDVDEMVDVVKVDDVCRDVVVEVKEDELEDDGPVPGMHCQ